MNILYEDDENDDSFIDNFTVDDDEEDDYDEEMNVEDDYDEDDDKEDDDYNCWFPKNVKNIIFYTF